MVMEDRDSSQALPGQQMRMILIGKTGAGKSTTGSTIIGEEVFKSQVGLNSETKVCGFAEKIRHGQNIVVVDTPGLCDTDGDDELIRERITQSLFGVAPGPHAIIYVVKGTDRFTDGEVKVFEMLKEIFGEKMTSFMIVIFVGKDVLDKNKVDFEKQLEGSKHLQGVLKEADNRYLLFNNEGDVHEKALMVGKLMEMVKQVVAQNGGGCFRHRFAYNVEKTMSKMVTEEIRGRTGQTIPVISEEAEYSRPKQPVAPKRNSGQGIPVPPHEAGMETADDGFSHAALQAVNSKQEVHDLHKRVKTRLQHFFKPKPKSPPEAEFRQRTPIQSSRNSFEIKEARGGDRSHGEVQMQIGQKAPNTTPPQSPQEVPEYSASEDLIHKDLVCHWKSGDAHIEDVLNQLQDQLVRELRTNDDAHFTYEVPVKPRMSLVEKQRLVEDTLKKKILNNPEELNEAQKEELEKVGQSVGQKIKEGMSKFALTKIDKCSLM
ncbi:hypothetical protein V1264_015425 [Littorina saxatilis]|uniref:AIG1-type G domain-containing protein n=2 Tax=Littorina saxatilis TaxID=31220 RepID=A0AAN9BJN0_9CAEN